MNIQIIRISLVALYQSFANISMRFHGLQQVLTTAYTDRRINKASEKILKHFTVSVVPLPCDSQKNVNSDRLTRMFVGPKVRYENKYDRRQGCFRSHFRALFHFLVTLGRMSTAIGRRRGLYDNNYDRLSSCHVGCRRLHKSNKTALSRD
jgi:hypothetical protein